MNLGEKQNDEIRVSCRSSEKEKIRKKAKEAGMSMRAFLLYLGLNVKVRVEPDKEEIIIPSNK